MKERRMSKEQPPHPKLAAARALAKRAMQEGARWDELAACRGIDPDMEIFFPMSETRDNVALARQICKTCPVSVECLADALDLHDVYGVRAGTTGPQRNNMLRRDGAIGKNTV